MALDFRSNLHDLLFPTSHAESSTRAGRAKDAGVRRLISEGANTPRIAILGAGAAGICMALQLLEQGITSFTIYEKAKGVGGTWRANTYPGAACDVPSHLYSFSFAPKVNWTRKFPEQPEILSYFESLVTDHNLAPHIEFNTEVTSATWDEALSLWRLELLRPADATDVGEDVGEDLREEDGEDVGESEPQRTPTEQVEAEIVVSGLGQLNRPSIPNIEGLETFQGTTFHSARWEHDHDLTGERVGVIGIGASAIQFVPQVAPQVADLTLFQRSVNYVAPKPDRAFKVWEQWVLRHVPGVREAYRSSIYWRFEFRFRLMKKGSRLGRLLQKKFGEQISSLASPKLPLEALVPDYTPGCRRILIANDWYPTLLRPNTRVITEGVSRITQTGIQTDSGEKIDLDTIIFGTGFQATEFLAPLRITGRDGQELSEVWRDGARAFLGVAVGGFPNFFILYGPNTNLGHNSILFMIEQQVGYIRQIIDEFVLRGISSIEVQDTAMDTFDSEISRATAQTVWAEDCSSWYKNSSGRVTNNWPDYTVKYKQRLAHLDPRDWLVRTASQAVDHE